MPEKLQYFKTKKEGRWLKLPIGKLQIKYGTISAVHYSQFPVLPPPMLLSFVKSKIALKTDSCQRFCNLFRSLTGETRSAQTSTDWPFRKKNKTYPLHNVSKTIPDFASAGTMLKVIPATEESIKRRKNTNILCKHIINTKLKNKIKTPIRSKTQNFVTILYRISSSIHHFYKTLLCKDHSCLVI